MTAFNWMQVLGIVLMTLAMFGLSRTSAPPSICVAAGFLAAWVPLGLVYTLLK